jgi:hypothetical protein
VKIKINVKCAYIDPCKTIVEIQYIIIFARNDFFSSYVNDSPFTISSPNIPFTISLSIYCCFAYIYYDKTFF